MSDSRPVRVLHLIDGLGGGGCERWLWDIIRLSNSESFEHIVITLHPDPGDYVYADRLRSRGVYHQRDSPSVLRLVWRKIQNLTERERLVPVRKSLTLTWRVGSYGLASWELLKALMRFRPEVVHAHTYHSLVAGLLMKIMFGKPLIHTVPASFAQMKDARHGWTPKLYAHMHRWVDRFFTGASYAEPLNVGVPASKVFFIPSGIDLQAIRAVKNERARYHAEIRDSLGLHENARIALSVGRLHPSKGHLFALESLPTLLSQFADLHWVVLGEGLQRAGLEARARELGISEHVHLVGFQAEPLPYYAAADIYLRTPVLEADNLSSYQAIAMGLPVVGFDTGRDSELIPKAGHGILVPNRDGAAFARAIASILALPDGGEMMGELGAEYSRKHLDIQRTVSPFFSAYKTLGNRRRADRRG